MRLHIAYLIWFFRYTNAVTSEMLDLVLKFTKYIYEATFGSKP